MMVFENVLIYAIIIPKSAREFDLHFFILLCDVISIPNIIIMGGLNHLHPSTETHSKLAGG